LTQIDKFYQQLDNNLPLYHKIQLFLTYKIKIEVILSFLPIIISKKQNSSKILLICLAKSNSCPNTMIKKETFPKVYFNKQVVTLSQDKIICLPQQ